MRFTSRFFARISELVSIKRIDVKNPNQSKDVLSDVGSTDAIVMFEQNRNRTFTSDAGLDNQSFRYKVYMPKGDLSASVRNKDIIIRESGTELHIGYCEDMKITDYMVAYCNDVRDPTAQRRH